MLDGNLAKLCFSISTSLELDRLGYEVMRIAGPAPSAERKRMDKSCNADLGGRE